MDILIDANNVVIDVKEGIEELETGVFQVDDIVYGAHLGLSLVTIADQDVTPQIHMIVDDEVVPNPDYVAPVIPEEPAPEEPA